MGVFGIISARDFLGKASRDFARLSAKIDDPDLAINVFLAAYHIREWLWAQSLKARSPLTVRGTTIRNRDEWFNWCDVALPHAKLIQELANGSKHCAPVNPTGKVAGYGAGPCGIGPFGKPYLLIDLGSQLPGPERYLTAHDVASEAMEFWNDLFAVLSI